MSLNLLGRIFILLLSFIGYTVYLKKKFDLRVEFAPIVICSSIGIIMFLAGIFHIMPIATYAIIIIGLIQLRLIRKDSFNLEEILKLSIFTLIVLYFFNYLKDALFIHYDNFSHWALVVREMLETNALPTSASKLIEFNAYPTGTAGFIYFVSKIVGNTDGIKAFGQTLILLSGIFSLTAFINKKNWYLSIVFAVFSVYFLVYNIFITDLLVDTILPILGVAIVAIIVYYRDRDLEKLLKFTMPLIAYLPIIKNSGIFFTIISVVMIYLLVRGTNITKKKFIGYSIVPSLVLMVLWKVHVMITFGKSGASKHSVSLRNYAKTILDKNMSDISNITSSFIDKTLQINNLAAILILAIIIVFMVVFIVSKCKHIDYDFKFEKSIILASLLIYVFYMLGLFSMYIFSMPTPEALMLAEYDRYHKTIIMYLFGIITIMCFRYSVDWKGIDSIKTVLLSVVLVAFAFVSLKYNVDYSRIHSNKDYSSTARYQINQLKEKYDIKDEKKYLIYTGSPVESSGYIFYASKYEFRSTDISVYNSAEIQGQNPNFNDYDYVISLKEDENILPILKNNGIDKYEPVIKLN